jgi:4-hydroxy-tetrahydrodipicolinate synthase
VGIRVSAGALHGIIAAVPTPLDGRGNVDEPALRRIVNRLVSAGMNGLWVLGSGSEFACLDPDQQERVLFTVTAQAAGRIPVIAGTGACSTSMACEAARRAESAGADAIFVIPPYYFSCSPSELNDHFLATADACSLPVVLYNNPWNTRTPLPLDLIASLAANPRFMGIKDSSADWDNLLRILNAVPRDGSFAVLQGNELALGPGILMGADGSVIALPVIAPELCLRIYRAARQGNVALVRELQSQVADLFQIYVDAERSPDSAFLSSQKAALELLGLCSRRVSRPYRDANDADMRRVELLLQKHNLLYSSVTEQGRL